MLHPRTLCRQLAKDGITYTTIKDEVLMERAKAELVTGKFSMGEIAELLGYTHQSAFTRAFRKFVGQSLQSKRTNLTKIGPTL